MPTTRNSKFVIYPMKNQFLTTAAIFCGFGLCLSCAPKAAEPQSATVQMTKDSIVVNDEVGDIALTIEHPADTTSALSQTFMEYVSETLGGTYTGKYTSPKALIAFYHSGTYKDMKKEYEELKNVREEGIKLVWNDNFCKMAETGKYITFYHKSENYLGGAHGMHTFFGVTIRKSDNRRMGWEILRSQYNEELQKAMRQGLKDFFEVKTDEELKTMFFKEEYAYNLPMPQCPPLFTDKGIMFVYNPYEIAPYAAGMPTFTIPYDKLKNLLTVTAQRLAE